MIPSPGEIALIVQHRLEGEVRTPLRAPSSPRAGLIGPSASATNANKAALMDWG